MPWLQLSFSTRLPELAEEVLLAQGALAVTLADAADQPILEPPPGATPLWLWTTVRGLFAADVAVAPVERALQEALGEQVALQPLAVPDSEWARIWLRDVRPLRFGAHLWVTPAEKRGEIADAEAIVVTLDPGLAFGTGSHASTALCLEWLAGAALGGRSVLDYGCGSGILAIAALKCGAASATAVDIDPQALLATRENAARNDVAERLEVGVPEQLGDRSFDVVVANILARPLIALAPQLAAHCAPRGDLVLAGLLDDQAGDVRAAQENFFRFECDVKRDGWTRLHGRKIGAPAK